MKIGIIYIAIGEYEKFWDIFYPSCQAFFCVDAEKGYEIFTDSERLSGLNYPNVTVYKVADEGFVANVSSKSRFMLSIKNRLVLYDYIFFLNGNFRFLSPIYSKEVVSSSSDFAFTALSFDEYLCKDPDMYPYDRNPECHACIAEGEGERYYQGGFFGGCHREIMEFNRWAVERIEEDLKKGVVAKFHDESYLNKYLINKKPHILNDEYAYYPQSTYSGKYKAELIDKTTFFGEEKIYEIRNKYFDYSFLFTADTGLKKLAIISMWGGLGNQMFIYSFYLYLRNKFNDEGEFLIDTSFYDYNTCHNGLELAHHFTNINKDIFLTEELKNRIRTVPVFKVREQNNSVFQELEEHQNPVRIYEGYWQCFQYAESNAAELRLLFQFDEKRLSACSSSYLKRIRDTNSVGIHIRRGDYLSTINSLIFANLSITNYYSQAMEKLKELGMKSPVFYIFSDDPGWVRYNFHFENGIVVDSEEENSGWQDMYLMSQCKHNIISNSTFAWWGAWLNPDPDKIVIAPETWFNGVDVPDLFPDIWIKIKPDIDCSFHQKIATRLLLKGDMNNYPGLRGGKMGASIYFFHISRILQDDRYSSIAEDLFESVSDAISINHPFDFDKNGLLGIAYGVQYLIEEKFVEGDPNEVLSDIDDHILGYINKVEEFPLPIIFNIMTYLTSRIRYNISIQNHEIMELFLKACKQIIYKLESLPKEETGNHTGILKSLLNLRDMEVLKEDIEYFILKHLDSKTFRIGLINNLLSVDLPSNIS
ncbi:alpha-1,2-fucosyltransferase [Proteiniphilum sp.]|uniref:alpha-1,2-fucosyltransferase n=1 Tax=Proteiniphilum sp. TaxID=1926877 RepID=UPI0033265BBF